MPPLTVNARMKENVFLNGDGGLLHRKKVRLTTLDLSIIMLALSFIIKHHRPAVLVIICVLCAVY